jgi:pyruvate dehydrogenase (quinone)/pyruvate decarboxylase
MVETLISWGATHCFGVVGDGINSIIEALRKRQDQIKYIGVRHEEAAAFMASGFAKQMMRLAADKRSMGNPGARTSSSWVPVPAPQVLAREPLF